MDWIHLNFQGEPVDPFARPPRPKCTKCGKGDRDGDGLLPELYWYEDIGEYAHEMCMVR